jgi:hypothetical protein
MSSSNHNERQLQARDLDRLSTALINLGVKTIKKNPIKVSLYFVGILLFTFFQGFKVTPIQREAFHTELQKLDSATLQRLEDVMYDSYDSYRRLRTNYILFESCKGDCAFFKNQYYERKKEYDIAAAIEAEKLSIAKSKLGIFSEYGIDETRTLFQSSFDFGKRIAKRQTQWDFFWYMISSVSRGRDESIAAYIIKIVMSVVVNFTMGVFLAVVNFMIRLFSILKSFHVSFLAGMF